ncbi:MAG TPA: alpha/beta hydrolase domain-containing protein [Methylomirabilota bacterium]|nr:alpha/beta hydrolase domain-containing protein [Methylomirabilota bacterium]
MPAIALEIQRRAPVLDGRPFGAAGAYEKVAGVLRFAADPDHPLHASICDLGLAPRSRDGRVEFAGDFYLLKPVDPARGNRRLLLDVPNRGRKVALGMLNSTPRVPDPTTPADFGNGFLMRHGWSVAWVGWQPDVPRQDGLMALDVPAARGVTGLVRCEFRTNARVETLPMADRYHVPYPTVDPSDPEARLTVREHAAAPEQAVPRTAWRFADACHVRLEGGFEPGRIYDLVYRSADPPLVGLGFLAVRDAAAFLRWGTVAEANPCAGALDRAYVFGVSQSGRFLRHLLYLGLTEDERGRDVFDAVVPHVAGARRGEFNMRFGQPSLNALQAVGSLFPFTDGEQVDPLTGERGALLARLRHRGRVPRILTINTAAEYWRGDGSLVHTDVEGKTDLEPPVEARVYLFAGAQHTPGALPPPDADPNTGGKGLQPFNTVDYAPLLRAALVSLDRWVSDGVKPPPSAFPRLADASAVSAESTAGTFGRIPGVRFPDRVVRPGRLDFGRDVERGVVTELPPKAGAPYTTFVSAVDADGNEIAGVRAVELAAPLATFTGWNPRHPTQGAPGDLMSMMGSTLPFAPTRAERARNGDPRASVEERYASRDAYLAAVRAAARQLVAARWMLDEDVEPAVERAGRMWDHFRKGLARP